VLLVLGLLGAALPRTAAAECGPDAALRDSRLRAHLGREARRARRWNIGWGVFFGVAAVAQLGLAMADVTPVGSGEAAHVALYVNGGKAAMGALARVVLPLSIARAPAPTGGPCVDLAASERALAAAARREKRSFWMLHAGSILVTVGGLLYLGMVEDSWKQGGLSVAVGYPVSLLSIYTHPRASWALARNAPPIVVTPLVGTDVTGLAFALTF